MSSKRALRRKACTGKVRHGNDAAARFAALRMREKDPNVGWLTTYRCQFCGGYHVGHPPKKVRQAIRGQR